MVASSLHHQKFAKSLTDVDFIINPHDPCVANKMIDGKQMTICWHVDDLKASHVNPKVVDRMIKRLRQKHVRGRIWQDGSEPRQDPQVS
jgi:hypothetical protein